MSYVSAKARQEFKVMNENEIKMTKKIPTKNWVIIQVTNGFFKTND